MGTLYELMICYTIRYIYILYYIYLYIYIIFIFRTFTSNHREDAVSKPPILRDQHRNIMEVGHPQKLAPQGPR